MPFRETRAARDWERFVAKSQNFTLQIYKQLLPVYKTSSHERNGLKI
jgi:hypothetical protein